MKKISCMSFILIFNIYASLAQNLTENEMKELAKEMVTIQARTYQFRISNDIMNIVNKVYDKYDIEILRYSLSTSVDINDVINFKEFDSFSKKFRIFKVSYYKFRTWFIVAFGFDGSYYLLRNFEFNHINNLIRQKIGKPKTINEYLDIGKLYINTVQFSDYGIRKVISASEYHNLKKKYKTISPPKLYYYNGDTIVEFFSLQTSTKKVKHHKLIFSDGLIKNVEETIDDR